MTITTEGITLPNLRLVDEDFAVTGITADTETADSGVLHVWENSFEGRPFDLVGTENRALIDRSVLTEMQALAAVINAEYTLNFHGTLMTYRFRHWEAPVIEADPTVIRSDQQATDKYNNVVLEKLNEMPYFTIQLLFLGINNSVQFLRISRIKKKI